jgi:predicted RNA-binding protein (virulence factor B family)
MTELGMNTVINNLYKGLIFNSDIHKAIKVGDKIKGFVKQVREDGKIDIVLEPLGYKQSIDIYSEVILSALKENNGYLNLTDKNTPEEIKQKLEISKKAFKKAIGKLYKEKLIELDEKGIKLLK